MWRLADRQIDEFLARGECEFISEFAGPFALLVIADLLGVPEEDHAEFRSKPGGQRVRARPRSAAPARSMAHNPLEFLYQQFTAYIEERRRAPRDDVLTGSPTRRSPTGRRPRSSTSCASPPTSSPPARRPRCGSSAAALQLIGERPDLQQLLRDDRDRIPNFVEETLRIESPIKGDFRLARVDDDDRRRRHPGRHDADGAERRREPRPAPVRGSERVPARPCERARPHRVRARHPQRVPAHRSRGPRLASASSGCSIAWPTSGSRRRTTARPAPAATSTRRRTSCAACSGSTWSSRRSRRGPIDRYASGRRVHHASAQYPRGR